MPTYTAKVKSILSGDTLILTALNNPASERQLSLAYVTAPRLSSNELYGFQSREYLRNLLVNKQVQFKVLYTINDREYGDVMSPVFNSLVENCLTNGTVKLRDDASSKDSYDEYKIKLEEAEQSAKSSEKGVWSTKNKSIQVDALLPDSVAFGTTSAQYPAIVESVISGDRLQIRAILNSKTPEHFVGVALIAGIKTPRSAGPDSAAEPYGESAKAFVAARLLQRSVKVQFIEKSSTGVAIVNVIHPVGDISEFLLKAGLATVADWQSQYIGAQKMSTLRAAEVTAKKQNLNIWKDAVNSSANNSKSYDAVIVKVVSPDTYVVADSNGDESTVQLASIRGPKKNDSSQAPFVSTAKEFARSKFIGKKVHVDVVAIRPKSDQFDERELVTITFQNGNIASTLVADGYASVIRHRKDDSDRSPIWDELIEKESEATASRKGMHSKKVPAPERTVDASETVPKARGFLTSLQRSAKISAIVDYISSGGRFRLQVPRENCILTLVLAGIRVPKPQEEGGEAALKFVVRRLWQRDVSFSVLNIDKTGGFIGHIFLPSSNVPLSLALVKEGLAEVHEFSAQNSGYFDELVEAEEAAKLAKKGLWKNYVEEKEPEISELSIEESSDNSGSAIKYVDVILTNITPAGQLSYRTKQSDASFLKTSAELTSFNSAAANSTSFTLKGIPKRNSLVTYVAGSKYYRAKVTGLEKDKVHIVLIDTGAEKVVPTSSLRQLPATFLSQPPAANSAELSFVEAPAMRQYLEEYVRYIEEEIIGKNLVANIDSNGPPISLTLYSSESTGPEDSINSYLIYNGYAYLREHLPAWAKQPRFSKTLERLQDLEEDCKVERCGLWEYGDPRDSDPE